ncbi:uncharacterized protein BDCG_17920 [Blastomyces dermatitidis ER-3]|uniref:Uncharacterized protein n=1 Tax=Ajellomyces dermatitidis (strain ER-3 / ATCC MYA-2586) TaxID=559297 RepID=A0ABX2W131_AJEDR|nr:uncharacterized protein BDCG_17920 [Blastomyces dermatitidis ER-3]OAT03091.1 hypothetical protein BDCG_17920 [Blastomyces dermatitidis ER-3]
MAPCSHNKCHHSAHTEQFISKSSCVDRFMFTDDSESDVESLIKNLKNVIMKKLSVSCVAESSAFSPVSSAASSPAAPSQSSTLASVSDSSAPTIPVPVISTSATPDFAISVFLTSSLCFKKMLHRLSKSHFSVFASVSEAILIEDDNTAETIFSHSQASSITFSPFFFSAEKVVCTSDCKYSVLFFNFSTQQ